MFTSIIYCQHVLPSASRSIANAPVPANIYIVKLLVVPPSPRPGSDTHTAPKILGTHTERSS